MRTDQRAAMRAAMLTSRWVCLAVALLVVLAGDDHGTSSSSLLRVEGTFVSSVATVWTLDTHACPQLTYFGVDLANVSLSLGALSTPTTLEVLSTPTASEACPTAGSGFGADFTTSTFLDAENATECDILSAYAAKDGPTGSQRIFSVERIGSPLWEYHLVTTNLTATSVGTTSTRTSQLLSDCAPQQIAYHDVSDSLVILCYRSTGGLLLRAFRAADTSVSSILLGATDLNLTLAMTHALVGASAIAPSTQELYFLGTKIYPNDPVPTAFVSRLYAVSLSTLTSSALGATETKPFAAHSFGLTLNETGAVLAGVQAMFYSESLGTILLLGIDSIRMMPISSALVTSALTSLSTFPLMSKITGSTWTAFNFSLLTPSTTAILDSNPRWLEKEHTMLVTVRQTVSNASLLLQLHMVNLGTDTTTGVARIAVASIKQKELDPIPMRWAGSLVPSLVTNVTLKPTLVLETASFLSIAGMGFESPQLRALASCATTYLASNSTILRTSTVTPTFAWASDGNVTLSCAVAAVAGATRLTSKIKVEDMTLSTFSTGLLPWIVVTAPVIAVQASSSRITAGTALTFTSTITSPDSKTLTSDLRYSWSSSTHPSLALLAAITNNASSLVFASTSTLSAGTYRFKVTVTDSASTHRNSTGSIVQGSAEVLVEVFAAISFDAVSVDNTDPCLTSTLCQNGATCVSTLLSSTGSVYSWSLSCTCATSPFTFYGPTCSLAVVSCSQCVSTYSGGITATIFGIGFSTLTGLAIDSSTLGVTESAGITYLGAQYSNSSTAAATLISTSTLLTAALIAQLEAITFVSPALVNATTNATSTTVNPASAYQTLELFAVLPSTSTVTEIDFPSLMFYSSSSCLAVGEFLPDGAGGCTACPTGGYCPGGGRCWPLAGYWSWSQYLAPSKCTVSEACPGVNADTAASGVSATVVTQVCSAAYTGTRCATCADNYYQLNGKCYACGTATDQTNTIILTIIIGLSAMMGLAFGVAFLDPVSLAYAVQGFMIMQDLAVIGVDGASQLPMYQQEVSETFTYINMINFDVEVLKPGCAIPSFTFVTKFRYTLLFMLITAFLFFMACVVRLLIRSRSWRRIRPAPAGVDHEGAFLEDDDEAETTGEGVAAKKPKYVINNPDLITRARAYLGDLPLVEFKQRLQHAALILAAIFYLRLTILQFKSFRCVWSEDEVLTQSSDVVATESYYLIEDMSTVCYTGSHLVTIVFVAMLLPCYTFGFPFWAFVLLSRAFGSPTTPGIVGWMWQRMKCLRGKKKRTRLSIWNEKPTPAVPASAPAAPEPSSSADKYLPSVAMDPSEDASLASAANSSMGPSAAVIQRDREARYGSLFVGYLPDKFVFCLGVFFVSFYCSLVTVFASPTDSDTDSTLLNLFLYGALWSVQTMLIAWQLPMVEWRGNVQKVVIGMFSLTHTVILVAVQSNGSNSPYFYSLLALFAAGVTLVLSRHRLVNRFCKRPVAEAQVKEISLRQVSGLAKASPRSKSISSPSIEPGRPSMSHSRARSVSSSRPEGAKNELLPVPVDSAALGGEVELVSASASIVDNGQVRESVADSTSSDPPQSSLTTAWQTHPQSPSNAEEVTAADVVTAVVDSSSSSSSSSTVSSARVKANPSPPPPPLEDRPRSLPRAPRSLAPLLPMHIRSSGQHIAGKSRLGRVSNEQLQAALRHHNQLQKER